MFRKIDNVFNKIAKTLSDNSELSYEPTLYVIRTYTHMFATLTLILFVAFLLGIFKWATVITLVFMILRSFSGGVHSRSKIICSIISLLIPIGGGLLIKNNQIYPDNIIIITSILMYIFGVLTIIKFTPADTPEKPIISIDFKKQLRKSALIFVTLLEIVIVILNIIHYKYFQEISLSIIWGLLFQLLSVFPFSYLFTSFLDNVLLKLGGALCTNQPTNHY